MTNFEFLSYDAVVGEKFLGVATIRAWSKIILRYKIIPGKEGRGFFASPASVKVNDKFESSFMLDSNFENQALLSLIKEEVSKYLNGTIAPPKPKETPSDGDYGECPF